MLPDFSESWSDFIQEDGVVKPQVNLKVNTDAMYHVDPDGLILTFTAFGVKSETCLLTVLFRMSVDAARVLSHHCRFPAKPGDRITVTKMIDRVTGDSGETYSRFAGVVT